ncbi:MAG: hypothetical protein ACLSUT_08650 [Christensenellales bacterium]|nr:MAG TPA: hypothetical protein [Caudoviricetes sp.]
MKKIVIREEKDGVSISGNVSGSMPECLGFYADAYAALDKLIKDFIKKTAKPGKSDEAETYFFDVIEKNRKEEC